MVSATQSPATAGEATVDGAYVLPVVHTPVPARVVELGFWGGLVGATLLGAIDPPLAVVVGVGVVVARHRRR